MVYRRGLRVLELSISRLTNDPYFIAVSKNTNNLNNVHYHDCMARTKPLEGGTLYEFLTYIIDSLQLLIFNTAPNGFRPSTDGLIYYQIIFAILRSTDGYIYYQILVLY